MMEFKTFEIRNIKSIIAMNICLSMIYLVFLISTVCFEVKDYKSAYSLIPFYTDALEERIYESSNEHEQIELANKILKFNKNVSGAYEALVNEARKKSDYASAIKYEEERLRLNKYTMYNYLCYADLLKDAISYCNDRKTLKIYIEKLCRIDNMIEEIINKTNPLCYKTKHVPNLEIPEKLIKDIEQLERLEI